MLHFAASIVRNYRHLRFVLAVALVLVAASATQQVAQAYIHSGQKWSNNSAYYDSHLMPSQPWQDAISYGRSQWNNVTPSPLWIGRNDTWQGDVWLEYIDGHGGQYAGVTRYPGTGSTIDYTNMRYDSGETWYLGTSTTTDLDARSVAAHEFGHHIGFRDTTDSTICPSGNNSSAATMCQYYGYGRIYWRSLESDDVNGLNAIYP